MVFGSIIGGNRNLKNITLNDIDGTDKFTVRDDDGAPVLQVDSLGNLKIRGAVQKYV